MDERCKLCNGGTDKALIAGPRGVHICRGCVETCNSILAERRPDPGVGAGRTAGVPTPEEIFGKLSDYVVGQDLAKRILAVAVYAHYRRVSAPERRFEKSNVLLVGPTGSGKTLLAKTLARILDVPLAIADATPLTEAGYVGEDVESILVKLLEAADHDVARAGRGIVYIDEIDKIARRPEVSSLTRDVSGEGVQQALLRILEGTVASVPLRSERKHVDARHVPLPTDHILFICGGAFIGIEQIIARRLGRQTIGFGGVGPASEQLERDSLDLVDQSDLIEFGLIPELVGRLPVIAPLGSLSFEQIIAAMTQPKNAIVKQFQAYFAMEGCQLEFTPRALRCIAEIVMERQTGVRALRSVFEELLLEERFQLPGRAGVGGCVVTEEFVTERLCGSHPTGQPSPSRRRQSA